MRDIAAAEVAIAVGWPVTAAGADSIVVFISDADADLGEIQKLSKARLPACMAPRQVRHVDSFPLNSNGKVDRKALLALLSDS